MGSRDAAVCYDSWSDSIYSSLDANLYWRKLSTPKRSLLHALRLVWYRGLQHFHQHFATHRSSYLTQRFRTLIHQSKGLFHCSVVQSLCALAYWSLLTLFCFLNSGFLLAILPYKPASQSLLLTMDIVSFIHGIGLVVMFWTVSLLSRKLVTNEIVLCIGKTGSI